MNMEVKMLEIRDRGTFVPALAVHLSSEEPRERYLLERAGFYGMSDMVLVTKLEEGTSSFDPHQWQVRGRTMPRAHLYIQDHWGELKSGDVVDVEYILGETSQPKKSEAQI